MTDSRTFVTIFPDTENFHLVKDVGQIPYFLHKKGKYDATIVTYKNSPDYPYLNHEVKGLKLFFMPRSGKFLYSDWSILKYLYSHSKNIDVLNLFHFKKENVLYLLLFKTLNPKGKTYVKLDMDILFFKNYNSFFYSRYRLHNYFLKILARIQIKMTDLFSVETDEAKEYLIKVYPELKSKLICVPNGVDHDFFRNSTNLRSFEQKENIIITAGRIGTFQKNTELLLESVRLTDLKDWKVYIAGPVEADFKDFIANFFITNPHLREQIAFTGNISDRSELFDLYNRAKIFCMTSRFEGFPIAFSEASFFGNYIISTPVASSSFVTDNGRTGMVVESKPEELSAAISKVIKEGFLNEDLHQEIKQFSKTNLNWENIITRITDELDKHAKATA